MTALARSTPRATTRSHATSAGPEVPVEPSASVGGWLGMTLGPADGPGLAAAAIITVTTELVAVASWLLLLHPASLLPWQPNPTAVFV
jgi:hypothetical protein